MKKIICLAFLSFNLLANAQGAISFPEFAILYSGYQNKIEIGCSGMETCEISLTGGTATKSSWTDQFGITHSGYIVSVKSGVSKVSITLSGINFKGQRVIVGTYQYKVKPFPKPEVTTTTISKTSAGLIVKLYVGSNSPFTGILYTVNSVKIDDVIYQDGIVPSSAVANYKVGDLFPIEVSFSRNGQENEIISSILTVVE